MSRKHKGFLMEVRSNIKERRPSVGDNYMDNNEYYAVDADDGLMVPITDEDSGRAATTDVYEIVED